MVNIAMERAIAEKLPSVRLNFSLTLLLGLLISHLFFNSNSTQTQVQFEVADATKRMFPDCSFDVIYSRDTILHIDNKPSLFKRFHVSISDIYSFYSSYLFFVTFPFFFPQSWLKPGGQLLISDYCCGEKPWTPVFETYVKQRGYILYTPPQYGKVLQLQKNLVWC